jgi:hypothetical protein
VLGFSGSSSQMTCTISCGSRFLKRYGRCPVSSSYRSTPSEYTSLDVVMTEPRACSGRGDFAPNQGHSERQHDGLNVRKAPKKREPFLTHSAGCLSRRSSSRVHGEPLVIEHIEFRDRLEA